VIIDYDVMFDTDFAWKICSAGVDCSVAMDLQNIATHETGHGIGLADIYDSSCSAVTMYGYSWYGDTQKRSLEPPDITGLQKLYGI
jgi:predicted Zn-dependent protease